MEPPIFRDLPAANRLPALIGEDAVNRAQPAPFSREQIMDTFAPQRAGFPFDHVMVMRRPVARIGRLVVGDPWCALQQFSASIEWCNAPK
jgi:hypothetical protein